MSIEAKVPWLIDEGTDTHRVTLIGDVEEKPPHAVKNLRALRDDNGEWIAIPRKARDEAEEDVRSFAIDVWRNR